MKKIFVLFASIGNWLTLTATNFNADSVISGQHIGLQPSLTSNPAFEELIKLLLSVAGGIISTVILNFLKRKFPDLFERWMQGKSKISQR